MQRVARAVRGAHAPGPRALAGLGGSAAAGGNSLEVLIEGAAYFPTWNRQSAAWSERL
jgi:hypothetical protein